MEGLDFLAVGRVLVEVPVSLQLGPAYSQVILKHCDD